MDNWLFKRRYVFFSNSQFRLRAYSFWEKRCEGNSCHSYLDRKPPPRQYSGKHLKLHVYSIQLTFVHANSSGTVSEHLSQNLGKSFILVIKSAVVLSFFPQASQGAEGCNFSMQTCQVFKDVSVELKMKMQCVGARQERSGNLKWRSVKVPFMKRSFWYGGSSYWPLSGLKGCSSEECLCIHQAKMSGGEARTR